MKKGLPLSLGLLLGLLVTSEVSAQASIVTAEPVSSQATIDEIQREIQVLQKTIDQLSSKPVTAGIPAEDQRFKVSGFATFSISASDSEDFSYLKISNTNITDTPTTTSDSRLGLQFTFNTTDKLAFVAQLLAEAKTRWQVEATWAYLEYTFDSNWSSRLGKMRLPYYLASEYIDVGYAYPWVRPPAEVYSVFIDNYTGAEVQHLVEFNAGWISQTKLYYGGVFDGERGDVAGNDAFDYALSHLWGIEERLMFGPFTFRASYTHGDFDLDVPGYIELNKRSYHYAVVGVAYDSEGLMFSYEQAHSEIEEYTENNPYTLTLGYNIGPWLPYAVFSEVDDEDSVFGDTRQKSLTLGARLYANSHIALKAAVQHCYDFDGTTGQFSPVDPSANAVMDDSINVYTFTIDSVF